MESKTTCKLIARWAVLLALIWTAVPAATAQEFIKEVKNHTDDYSVIHEYGEGEWLVSDFHLGESVFSLFSDLWSTTQQKTLAYIDESDSTIIRDFKIFNDTVYFCGQAWYGKNPIAIWGYFPMSNFQFSQVFYVKRDYYSLDKIEVFSIDPTGQEVHVVMLGQNVANQALLVDEIRTAPNQFNEYVTYWNEGELGDDLIQTANYVSCATRTSDNFGLFSTGKIFVFDKPTTTGLSILQTTTRRVVWNNIDTQPIHMEHCGGDAMAILFMKLSTYHVVGLTTPLSYYSAISFSDSSLFFLGAVKDMCYNPPHQMLDILSWKLPSNYSIVYHVSSLIAMAGGTIPFYRYSDDKIYSFDYYTTLPAFVVASGRGINDGMLRVYRYDSNVIPQCPGRNQVECKLANVEWKPVKIELEFDKTEIELENLNSFFKELPVINICNPEY